MQWKLHLNAGLMVSDCWLAVGGREKERRESAVDAGEGEKEGECCWLWPEGGREREGLTGSCQQRLLTK